MNTAITPFRYWSTLKQACSGISDGGLQSPRSVEQKKIKEYGDAGGLDDLLLVLPKL